MGEESFGQAGSPRYVERRAEDLGRERSRLVIRPILGARMNRRLEGLTPGCRTCVAIGCAGFEMRGIGEGGRDTYYAGAIGAEIARAVQLAGGVLTLDDLAACRWPRCRRTRRASPR
jgi:hypothetical protein